MKTRWIPLTALLILALTGCGSSQTDTAKSPGLPVPDATLIPAQPTQATPDRISTTMTKLPERVPTTEVTTPLTGEVPSELLNTIITDLGKRVGVSLEKISVTQAQGIIWNNGSLGCPQPGEMYTQALVNGYWMILEIEGQKYDYRASETGYFFLCEGGLPPISTPSTPNS